MMGLLFSTAVDDTSVASCGLTRLRPVVVSLVPLAVEAFRARRSRGPSA
jgi:hypothetical protein